MDNFIQKILTFIADKDIFNEVYWIPTKTSECGFQFYILCNDFFFWGCSDAEDVTPESFEMLEQAFSDGGDSDGALLYCSRKRGMRPQGAAYILVQEKNWPLFDACGPERSAGIGNPENRPK